ncbi:MAG TPA: dihydrodipicolinate synthase family protein [Chthoniobacteraceae bacterium]|nr:dihydrodipicolinate synthase family protein [Chthoniobacteraceae bacterium]
MNQVAADAFQSLHLPELIPALVTPCSAPGVPDAASLRRLCRHLYGEGVTGLFVLGSSGELPLLGEGDRLRLIEAVREASPAEGRLYAGVSGTGTAQAVGYARDAAQAGADVAVFMAPFFLKLDQRQLVDYVTAIADESPIPVAIYHHLRMPSCFEETTVARLARHPRVVAFKETSGDPERLRKIALATRGEAFRLFQGSESLVLATLRHGGHGCVTALANLCPGLHADLLAAHGSGDTARADFLQERLTELWKIFRLPDVGRSFGHFLQTLKLPLVEAGLLSSAATMIPGFCADAEFQREVLAFYRQWLQGGGVSRPVGPG